MLNNEEMICFDDVLIKPKYSTVNSRKDVSLFSVLTDDLSLQLPIISSNMDTVTGHDMAVSMYNAGAAGCLHRFWSVADNVAVFDSITKNTNSANPPWVSVGLGANEFTRAVALHGVGAKVIVLDVANGAQKQVVDMYERLYDQLPGATLVVGNFATAESIEHFIADCGYGYLEDFPSIIKVGIGPGSACTTRIKTGCGVPQLSAIMDCAKIGVPIIADGGMRTPGDIAKSLAAGAKAVMLGGMLAGTNETPGGRWFLDKNGKVPYDLGPNGTTLPLWKLYRGSASKESYDAQGKDQSYITAEGESFLVQGKGPVVNVLRDIEGGLRSAFTYVGARTVKEFQEKAEFVRVTYNGMRESGAHGANK